ncbi:Rieske (2Fe-2S) protein [Actinomycetospora cinnamomea]|uniref:Toluene 4-monooxygenase protein C n=1 Tax=Actinomycetospora cinnamomea TaxID=663609 RepID=A0A2U1FDP1_9PSEU|nr:Rieske 2Fe-2S domain-containing protein [Actinomycetospora cinnamomea]PVZ10274.1 toluene 4-monooxygenase protein C [Actinomycetospora cinnamomea]
MPESTYTPVASLETVRERATTAVTVSGRRVLLVHVDGEVHAYDNRCPHRAWPLERGTLADGVLTCANHRYTFDAATGRGIDAGGCDLVAYPCRVDDEGTVAVAVPRGRALDLDRGRGPTLGT